MTETVKRPRATTRTISIDAAYSHVFGFLSSPQSLLTWSIVDITSAVQVEGRWWKVKTIGGHALLRIRSNPIFGVLDFDFDFDDARWSVPSRVVPNGPYCEYVITLFAPTIFAPELFELQIALIDEKLERLKALMEGNAT